MNDNPNTAEQFCPACHKPIASDMRFCSSCGAKVMDSSMLATIDSYIGTKLDQEIARRFADQGTLAREIADRAEDTLWKRLRIAIWCAAGVGLVLSFLGIKTFNDLYQGIVTATAGRVDEVRGR